MKKSFLLGICLMMLAGTAQAATTTTLLTFADGIPGFYVGNFYDASKGVTFTNAVFSSYLGDTAVLSTGPSMTMTVNNGFDTTLSFDYALPVGSGTVTLYGKTGDELDLFTLGQTQTFLPKQFDFSGVAYSASFAGLIGPILVDDIQFTSTSPVPIPASIFLFGSGLSGLGFWRMRRKT